MRASSNLGFSDLAASRVIYHSSKVSWYLWLLVLSKVFRCIGVFVAYDAVRSIHVVYFLLLVTLLCSIVYGFVQRPLSGSKKLPRGVWINVARHAFVQTCLNLLWFYGLAHVGPLRAILLSEHADTVVLAVWGAVLKGIGGAGKLRGSLWFVLGVLSLVLFDNDSSSAKEHPEGQQHHGISHILYYLLAWTGLSDHEGGIVVLLLTLCLQAYVNNGGRRLAIDVGGSKRLHSLTAIVSTTFLCPFALIIWLTQNDVEGPGALQFLPQAFVVSLFVFAFHYYVDAACVQRLDVVRTARVGTLSIFFTSLLISSMWKFSTNIIDTDNANEKVDHAFSGGVVFSIIMFSAATLQMTSNKERWRNPGAMSGLPLHVLPGEALHRSQSLISFITSSLKVILADANSRTIFYFLCVNLGFTFVEFTYGVWTNSLGLISDGFHMLFDCSALIIGLGASVMAKWKPTKTFPFGYGRVEVLSGFINGLFLSVIGLMVLYEAVGRLFEPPEVHTEKLLVVAVCGLLVNLFGILSFSHSHSHGHSHSHSHGHSHSHSHGHTSNKNHGHGHSHAHSHAHGHSHSHAHGHSHGHSHSANSHGHSHFNANMQGVFLHIIADTMGSVAVIVSSLLIDWYGWLVADPLCSLILSLLILASVLPLLRESVAVLVLRVPYGLEEVAKNCIDSIVELEHVLTCKNPRFWQHAGETLVSTVVVQCSSEVSEQRIIQSVTAILQDAGFTHVTVEVEVVPNQDVIQESPTSQWGMGTIGRSYKNPYPSSIRAV